MNEPQYKISGTERHELKRKLSRLKSYVRNFWHYHQLDKDMTSIYGGYKINEKDSYPMNDEMAQQKFDKANEEVKILQEQLSVPFK